MAPFPRLLLASAGAIYLLKIITLTTRRAPTTRTGLLVFLFAWPGVIPDSFRERRPAEIMEPARFLAAAARMALGASSTVLLAVYARRMPDLVLGMAGTAALLLTFHLGVVDLLPWLLRWAGFAAPLLFDRPWSPSRSPNSGAGDGTLPSSK